MKRITLSGISCRLIPVCFLLLSSLLPAATTSMTKTTATKAIPTGQQPTSAATHTGEGIVNGKVVRDFAIPWVAMVARWGTLNNKERVYNGACSGEFISKKWVLTARHCVLDLDGEQIPAKDIEVAGGSYFVAYLKKKLVAVNNVYLMNEKTDVALLELKNDYPFEDKWVFKDVPLYHGDGYMLHNDVMLMGFGLTKFDPLLENNVFATELNYTTSKLQGLTARDTYGAPALLASRESANGGYAIYGDSGGPALLSLFKSKKETDFTKLIGVISYGSPPKNSDYNENSLQARLSENVLAWMGSTMKLAIIRSPSDEQVFETTTTESIPVNWYGDAPPARVVLTKTGKPNEELSYCEPGNASYCYLDINQKLKDGDYDISVVRTDKSMDTVTVRFKSGGTPLSIVYPPKNKPLYTYLPDFSGGQILYTVSGHATAGDKLTARLTRTETAGEVLPELDKNNNPCINNIQGAIKANEQGIWVCNIKVRQGDSQDKYKFEIQGPLRVISEPSGLIKREVDTVSFMVDGQKSNNSSIDADAPFAGYTGMNYKFTVFTEKPYNSTVVSTPDSGGRDVSSRLGFDLNRFSRDGPMDVKTQMYWNIKAIGDIPFVLIEPDASKTITVNFVKETLSRPVQTMESQKASFITPQKMKGYVIKGMLELNGVTPTRHTIYAVRLNPNGSPAAGAVELCQNATENEGEWSCPSRAMLEAPYFYEFREVFHSNAITNRARVHVPTPPVFDFPKLSTEPDNPTLLTKYEFSAKKINGRVSLALYEKIQRRRNSGITDKGAGIVDVYRSTNGVRGNHVGHCDIEIYTPSESSDNTTYWRCTQEIKGLTNGIYESEVKFYARDDDAIGETTYLTLSPPAHPKTNSPSNGSEVTGEAFVPAGTGEPNADMAVYENAGNLPKSLLSNRSANSSPICTTKVDEKGNWQCGLVSTPSQDGTYKLTAIQKINNQEEGEDDTTFNVKRKNDDNNTDPKPPGNPGDAPPGPSIPVGPPVPPLVPPGFPPGIKPGECKVGWFIFKSLHCIAPPPGSKCPSGYTHNTFTHSCHGKPNDNTCPSGYLYDQDTKECTGPTVGGPDFKILFPQNKMRWDCSYNNSCQVFGQIPEGDSARITVVDPASGKIISGPYNSEEYNKDATWWQTPSITLPPGSTLNILATRMHNGQAVPSVDSVQAVQITTSSDTPYVVQWPLMYEEVKSEAQDVIHGTAPTGTRVQVRSEPQLVSCDAVSAQEHWSCPVMAFTPGSYTLTTTWQSPDANAQRVVDDIRYFSANPLPTVSITTPSDSSVVKGPYNITGTGYPGAKVSVTGMPSGDECTDRAVDGNGKWACDASYPLVNGQWFLTAQQTFSNGLSNAIEQGYLMEGIQEDDTLVFTSPAQDEVLTTGTYKITGMSNPFDFVTVTGMPVGSPACENVVVDGGGYWECPADYPLVDGHYRLRADSESEDGWFPDLIAWRDFSMIAPLGPVANITELKTGSSGCQRKTNISYECITVLHLSDRAGKAVPGQQVNLSMSGLLHLSVNSPNPAISDENGDITVTSGGTRDSTNGLAPTGILKATSGNVSKDFRVP